MHKYIAHVGYRFSFKHVLLSIRQKDTYNLSIECNISFPPDFQTGGNISVGGVIAAVLLVLAAIVITIIVTWKLA